jgi:hypothetical protein
MLELSKLRKKMPFHINHGLAAFNIHMVREWDYGYALDFDVTLPSLGINLQRPFCWTLEQKQELIMSVLKGIKLPPVALIHYNHEYFQVIDGKQRIGTMLEFYDGNFPIIFEEQEYYFKDLDPRAKHEIADYYFIGDVGYEYPEQPIADEVKIAWFNLINFAGTPQDKEHMLTLQNAVVKK